MKFLISTSLPLFLVLLLLPFQSSCSEIGDQDIYNISEYTTIKSPTRSFDNPNDSKVSFSDIVALTKGQNRNSISEIDTKDLIHCIVDEMNDTLLYACDLIEGGWVIYASDKRIPAIIMQSEFGSFNEFVKAEGSNLWLKSMIQEMKDIRNTDTTDLIFTKDEIENNINFWKSICDPDGFIKSFYKNRITRGQPTITDSIINPIFLKGHYEYYATYRGDQVYDTLERLITTDWHESDPFNTYCPFKSNESGKRAPAGSMAISAAQILYFFNTEFGVPATAPSTAYCNHRVDDNYTDWAQTEYSDTIWERMKDYDSAAAPLIADIGRRVNMKYGNDISYCNPEDLVNKVFAPYGLTSHYKKYDVETLKDNLLKKLPVIIEARDKSASSPYTFIIDRYKRLRYTITNVYIWQYDNIEDNKIVPCVPDSISYSYSTPYIDQIGINWGMGSHKLNSEPWYPLMGDWRIYDAPYNFNENRKMIYFDVSKLHRKQ